MVIRDAMAISFRIGYNASSPKEFLCPEGVLSG